MNQTGGVSGHHVFYVIMCVLVVFFVSYGIGSVVYVNNLAPGETPNRGATWDLCYCSKGGAASYAAGIIMFLVTALLLSVCACVYFMTKPN